MLPSPTLDVIRSEFGEDIDLHIHALARQDYEQKLVSETHLLDQFKSRPGLTESELITMGCKFLMREAVYLASHIEE